ncbi:MAG: hypothetical protein KatS3mg035_0042 [Bacteroidia bacterium]|nr:MAG: hypothetical protein KatS3mg035_0042 [Bacteroidia bacterium]
MKPAGFVSIGEDKFRDGDLVPKRVSNTAGLLTYESDVKTVYANLDNIESPEVILTIQEDAQNLEYERNEGTIRNNLREFINKKTQKNDSLESTIKNANFGSIYVLRLNNDLPFLFDYTYSAYYLKANYQNKRIPYSELAIAATLGKKVNEKINNKYEELDLSQGFVSNEEKIKNLFIRLETKDISSDYIKLLLYPTSFIEKYLERLGYADVTIDEAKRKLRHNFSYGVYKKNNKDYLENHKKLWNFVNRVHRAIEIRYLVE